MQAIRPMSKCYFVGDLHLKVPIPVTQVFCNTYLVAGTRSPLQEHNNCVKVPGSQSYNLQPTSY